MEINRLIENSHKESIGKYYFSKAVSFAINKEFGKSYEFFKLGLDILTCDCNIKDWLKDYINSDKKLFDDINVTHTPHYEYFFVKAYMMSYEKDEKDLYFAFDAIERYLEHNQDEYGCYVKGKILIGLDNSWGAIECFENASSYRENPRLLYRIGRTKEQLLEENGIKELYYSFIKNPSSVCCARNLRKSMKDRGRLLNLNEGESNILLLAFNNIEDEWYFHVLYDKLLESQLENNEDSIVAIEDNTRIINAFVQGVKDNVGVFIEREYEEESEQNYEQNDFNDYFEKPDYDRDSFYALTDGQYGDYDDWSEEGGDMGSLRDGLGY